MRKVIEFIERNLKDYAYCHSEEDYVAPKLSKMESEFQEIETKYEDKFLELSRDKVIIYIRLDRHTLEFTVTHVDKNLNTKPHFEKFKNKDAFEARLLELIDFYQGSISDRHKKVAE